MLYQKRPYALKKKDNPKQLYQKLGSSNDLIYEIRPVDKFWEMYWPIEQVPNYYIEEYKDAPKTFEELRPKWPMVL